MPTLYEIHIFQQVGKYSVWDQKGLTHLPPVPHMSVNWVSIGSDNGLSPIQHQAIIQTNAGLLSIGPLGTNFSEILNYKTFHSRKYIWK